MNRNVSSRRLRNVSSGILREFTRKFLQKLFHIKALGTNTKSSQDLIRNPKGIWIFIWRLNAKYKRNSRRWYWRLLENTLGNFWTPAVISKITWRNYRWSLWKDSWENLWKIFGGAYDAIIERSAKETFRGIPGGTPAGLLGKILCRAFIGIPGGDFVGIPGERAIGNPGKTPTWRMPEGSS